MTPDREVTKTVLDIIILNVWIENGPVCVNMAQGSSYHFGPTVFYVKN
jgi:hypothetical protein